MIIHKAGECSIAMLINRQELEIMGISWSDFDDSIARQWIYDALISLGATSTTPLSIDAFENNGGILIFATLMDMPSFLRFDNFEALLDAIAVINEPEQPNNLYSLRDSYILALHGGSSPQWHEFARPWDYSVGYLNEHGKLLLRGDAVGQLKHFFVCRSD